MKTIEVVAAIVFYEGKILCVQRGESKYNYIAFKFEFPGGKVEPGESNEQALIREIKEELRLDIAIVQRYVTVEYSYPDFNILMHSYVCSCEQPNLQLTEHVKYLWLEKEELLRLDWAAADIPIVNELLKYDDRI